MRKKAFLVIKDYYQHHTFLNLALKKVEDDNINQITIRVYGVIENKLYLEYMLNELTDRRKLDLDTKIILMMALYENIYLDSSKDYAIRSEYTNLAKKVANKSVKYIGYFLNNHLVNEKIIPTFSNEEKNESIIYSMPQYIIKTLKKQYPNEYLDLINKTKKTTFVRQIKPLISNADFENFMFDDFFVCKTNVIKTEDFINKNIIVQDLGSYLVTKLLNPVKEDLILDMCAAPGNKTNHIYKYCQNVIANEIHESRFALMKENFKNHGYDIQSINTDASDFEKISEATKGQKFKKILIDAPCSGMGVINSKPEIKYNINLEETNKLIKLQKEIFDVAIKLLDKEGVILYSTCSINQLENNNQVEYFVEKYNLEIVENQEIRSMVSISDNGYTLLPSKYNSDGFFMCLLKRKK